MVSVLKTIQAITQKRDISRFQKINRYGVTAKFDKSKHSFFFSTPIYDTQRSVLIEGRFIPKGNGYFVQGSSAEIFVSDHEINLHTATGKMRIFWKEKQEFVLCDESRLLRSAEMSIYPTFNGVLVRQAIENSVTLFFESNLIQEGEVKANSKFFAYMKGKYEPFLTLGAMYAENANGQRFYGLNVKVKQETSRQMRIEIKSRESNATRCAWEINAYEPKLIQDTTVESNRPTENNVFGNVTHLGRSSEYGTQYLYSRFDFTKLPAESKKNIRKVYWHIPYYAICGQAFEAAMTLKRFCSFGSRWDNKVAYEKTNIRCYRKNGFVTFDLSEYFLDTSGNLLERAGIVLRSSQSDAFGIFATADNYFTPQIIELEYQEKE